MVFMVYLVLRFSPYLRKNDLIKYLELSSYKEVVK